MRSLLSLLWQQNAPKEALALMPRGGISLRYEVRDLGGEKFGIHHYVVPVGRNPNGIIDPPRKGPITRDEITPGPILKLSPFYVDIFALSGSKPTRLHSATYSDEGDLSSLNVKYLQPTKKLGPILLIESGYTHWKS